MDMQGNLRVAGAGYLNFCEDPYFTEPVKGNDAILGPLVNTVTNEMTMFYGSPIKDANGKVMSTLLIAANGDILCEVCEKVNIGKTGGGFYKENGTLMYMSYCPVAGTSFSSAVNQIASNIESLEHMIDNQAAGVAQASSAVEEMVGNIKSVNISVEKMVSSFRELEENTSIGIQTQDDVNERIQQIGSKQITDTLMDMNGSTSEVKVAAAEMTEGNKLILKEVQLLQAATMSMQQSINNMTDETDRISESGSTLSEISMKVTESINQIEGEINQFKV